MVREAIWQVPEPLSVHEVRVDEDTGIFLRRHGNPEGARLILCHGNSMAVDLYYPFWSLLTEDFDLVVYDMRSHGWNTVAPLSKHNIPAFVSDLDFILDFVGDHYGEKPQAGVFHSVSSMAPLLSPTRGSRLSALVLFDPPLCKPHETNDEFDAASRKAETQAKRRMNRFETLEDFKTLLGFTQILKHALPGVDDLMARTVLRESADADGYELRCPREHEAQINAHARIFAAMIDLEAICCPVKVIGADPTLPYSYLPTFDPGDILTVDYDFLPDATHFLQLEQPENCVEMMLTFLKSNGLA